MLSNHNNLAPQQHWDGAYESLSLQRASREDPIRRWLEEHIPRAASAAGGEAPTCFELGCFPGRYMAVFGELGYELHGVDLTPRTLTDMVPWLKREGFRTGAFSQDDFFTLEEKPTYDIVSSFGFIEHFPNWRDVLLKQMSLVKPGGYLVVSTPNFRGLVQQALHFTLDRENYDRHYIPSMVPDEWSSMARAAGWFVRYSGFFSRFSFWADTTPQHRLHKGSLSLLRKLTPVLARILPPNQPVYAPFCGLIAQRPWR